MVMEEAMDSEMSLSNMVLGFLEDAAGRERWPDNELGGDDDDGASGGDDAESKAFWQAQHCQLHEALAKCSPAESRIRADTGDAIRNARAAAGAACSCTGRPAAGDCRRCMLRHVAERLRDSGYNSALCKSKWTRSPDIPSGEHSYVDVVVQTRSGKTVRVVVELTFRAEFEVARAGGRAPGGVRRPGRPPAGRGQGHVRRRQAVHEGEQHAHGPVEEAQVHAVQVARHHREDGSRVAGGGGHARLAREADQVQGVHAELRLCPDRRGGRVMMPDECSVYRIFIRFLSVRIEKFRFPSQTKSRFQKIDFRLRAADLSFLESGDRLGDGGAFRPA